MVVMPDPHTTALWDTSGPQSRVNIFSPGIIGLFIQGIETGLVFSQLATWLSLPRNTERRFITVLTVFITTVGLVQTAIYFLSTWRIYVEHFGEPLVLSWTERVHIILTGLVATPVQSLLIWRCYYILKRNVYFIVPLLLLLLGSVTLGIFDTICLFSPVFGGVQSSRPPVLWSLLMYGALSLTSVSLTHLVPGESDPLSLISDEHPVFYYLTQSRKRIYADHTIQVHVTAPVSTVSPVLLNDFFSKWISRHIIIVWQSVIPPTVCALGISILYGVSQHLYPGPSLMWYPMLQAMIGKLYVLSHFYNINSRTQFVGEQQQPSTYMSALTVPVLHGMSTAHNAPEEHPLGLYSDPFERTEDRKGIVARN
ncbi:hypothetical protein BJY52DRAFT_1211640 [Lactarius psammicola]|nr:hypothetical protein BJY52DRAFT_1211640 [Lactarius psammicola]